MTPRGPHDRLDPEERALADALARTGPHGQPPDALDARILASARAAAAPRAATRRRMRVPVVLGVAASLVVAFVLVVQLRPLLDAPTTPATGVDGQRTGEAADAAAERAAPVRRRALERPGETAAAQAGAAAVDADDSGETKVGVVAPPVEPPARTIQAPTPVPAAPPPRPPPSPPAAATPQAATAPEAFPAPAPVADAPDVPADSAERSARLYERAATGETEATGALQASESMAAADAAMAPPAGDSDALAARRDAELARIRVLRDAGELAAARAALAAWRQRWPDDEVPADLRALAE